MHSDHFRPDWLSPPGDTILSLMRQIGVSQETLAESLGTSGEDLDQLLKGVSPLTPGVATKLELTFGVSRSFWIKRETIYREAMRAALRKTDSSKYREWLKRLPVIYLKRQGLIPAGDIEADSLVVCCMRFFGVTSIEDWNTHYTSTLASTAFRHTPKFESEFSALATWLRLGEIYAARLQTADWQKGRLIEATADLRALTREPDPGKFLPALSEKLAACGVALMVLKAPTGCRASGLVRRLSKKKAMILLSGRYLSDDQLWFSVFHEIAHLVLHDDLLTVEGVDEGDSLKEKEANEYAALALIPRSAQADLMRLDPNARAIIRFAREQKVAPGIVVGQMQKYGKITFSQMNHLKRRYQWNPN